MLRTIVTCTLLTAVLTTIAYRSLPELPISYTQQVDQAILVSQPVAGLDAGQCTKNALEGTSELISRLQASQVPSEKLNALKLHIAVIQAYLALIVYRMEPEDRAEVIHMSQELFKTVAEDKGKSKS